jgi:hypothetical protein
MTFIPDDIYMLIMFNKILMKHNKTFSEKAFNLIDEDKENNKILLYRYQCGCVTSSYINKL